MAPPNLRGRDANLAELARFCLDDDQGPYTWWQAEPWAGKTALLATFVHTPPAEITGRVWLVSFFVTAGLASQCTREAFLEGNRRRGGRRARHRDQGQCQHERDHRPEQVGQLRHRCSSGGDVWCGQVAAFDRRRVWTRPQESTVATECRAEYVLWQTSTSTRSTGSCHSAAVRRSWNGCVSRSRSAG